MASDTHHPPFYGPQDEERLRIRDSIATARNEAREAMAAMTREALMMSGVYEPISSGFAFKTGAISQSEAYINDVHRHGDAYAKNLVERIEKRYFRLNARELHFNKIDLLRIAIRHKWNIEFRFAQRSGMDMQQSISMPDSVADDFLGSLPPLVAVQEEYADHPLRSAEGIYGLRLTYS